MLDDYDDDSSASWIGFSDLFFHLFIFFLIVFALVKISAVAKVENDKEIIYELKAQVKSLEEQLNICLEKAAKCKDDSKKVALEKDKLALRLQILATELDTCNKDLEKYKNSLRQCKNSLTQCNNNLSKYKYLEKYLTENNVGPDISQIEKHKQDLIGKIAARYWHNDLIHTNIKHCSGQTVPISETDSLCLENTTLQEQTISFGSSILFQVKESQLRKKGAEVLQIVGNVIKEKLAAIQEIQIQGHADITGSQEYNLTLASDRAKRVFLFFKNQVGINPAKVLMSATSFGSFKPVNRTAENKYDWERIIQENNTTTQKELNRRIEIVLTYRR